MERLNNFPKAREPVQGEEPGLTADSQLRTTVLGYRSPDWRRSQGEKYFVTHTQLFQGQKILPFAPVGLAVSGGMY